MVLQISPSSPRSVAPDALATNAPASNAPGGLRLGAVGPDVSALQKKLNAQGERLEVNGSFGPRTQEAVRRFQLAHGIQPANGVAGASTTTALAGRTRTSDGFQAAVAKRVPMALTVPSSPTAASVASSLKPAGAAALTPANTAGEHLADGANRYFDNSPRPQDQKLAMGQATGFHAVRTLPDGRNVLDSSDAIRVPASPAQLEKMVEGSWTSNWWGGTSQTAKNAQVGKGEVSDFNFIPAKFFGKLPVAKAHVTLLASDTTTLPDGRTVTTYEARLAPHTGHNAGDDGPIKNSGDISGNMRLHIVDNKDGTSTFQLDWEGMALNTALIDASKPTGGSVLKQEIDEHFIDLVGAGHNATLRPAVGKDRSGFAEMFEKLGVPNEYRGSVDFKALHPELAQRIQAQSALSGFK